MRFTNHESSVRVCLRIKMKLHGVFSVYVFGVIGLAEMVSSLCFVKNTAVPKVFLYQCFRTNDYLADVKMAPIDIPRVSFTNSKIKVVRDGSFTHLSTNLERLAFFHCGVEDIEDNAFQGLIKLDLLAFTGNKLRVIKSAWFKDLSNLKTVSFQSNLIKHVDNDFFSILPPLGLLDISMNEITCLDTNSFGNFKTDEFLFRNNHLTPMCQAKLMKLLNDKNIRYNDHEVDYLDTHYDITKICVEKLPESELDEGTLNKCIEEMTRKFLPANGNYTIKQVCELLNDTPSPFLDCTSV